VQLLEPLTDDLSAVRRGLEEATSRGSTALVDAVYAALRLPDPSERRTAIVVFSDGLDTLSWLAAPTVVEAAGRSNAIVYAVAVRARGERKERFLGDVVRATGGRLFEVEDEGGLQQRFLDVLADIRARYVLSYAPSPHGREGWHELRVRLRNVKGDVLARPGYWRSGEP
jgi:VWFA-related protein